MDLSLHEPSRPQSRPATWDDLLEVPEGFIGEIIGGKLVMSPRPGPPHIEWASDLGTMLGGPFRFGIGGPGGWRILHEPRLGFGGDVRVPDLAGWRTERYNAPAKGPYTVPPDWICEVLSPRTAQYDRGEKLELYRRHGVRHVWLLDPRNRVLQVFRAHEQGWLQVKVFTRAEKIRAEPFDAAELDLGLLWPALPPEAE